MQAPVIETERLRLRAHLHSDLDPIAAMLGDPAVMRHIGGQAHPREDAWRRMLCGPGMWSVLGYGYWVVERRDDGVVIGQAGLADFKRAMDPSIEGLPEAGWLFATHAHGQGYAREAVQAMLGWADTRLPADEVVAIIDPDNASSIRLAERTGFAVREEARYKAEPILLFRRPRAAG